MSHRIVCWFSHGAASAVATKLAIIENNKSDSPIELIVACIHLEDEHPDGKRFADECEKWFGQDILYLRDEKYGASVDSVIEKTKYMSGVYGARCTKELKKQVRLDWQRHDDIHVFGMTVDEQDRIDNLIDSEPDLELWAPLIDSKYTKKDCFDIITALGIELPMMYRLGYYNNNCIGCLKAGGAGYWNKIRVDFPDIFDKRAKQEEMVNVALVMMTTNVYFNKHRDEAIRDFEHFNKFIKFNGSGEPIVNKGKINNCTLVDKELLDEVGGRYSVFNVIRAGYFKKCDYVGVLIETKVLISDYPDVLLAMLCDREKYPIIRVFNTRVRIPLRFLPESAGSHKDLDTGACGFFCEKPDVDINILKLG